MPYLDVWDNKPPGIFALMSVLMPTPDSSTLGLALTESCFLAIAGVLIYTLLGRLELARIWRVVSVATFLLLNALGIYSDGGGYTELFTLAPSVAAILCWVRGKSEDEAVWFVFAGASVAIGTLFKLPAVAPMLAFIAFAAFECMARTKPIAVPLRQCIQVFVGFALPWVLASLYFMRYGAAGELLRVSFVYPFAYGYSNLSTQVGVAGVARRLYPVLWPVTPLIVSVLVGFPWAMLRRRQSSRDKALDGKHAFAPLIVIALWLGADAAGAFAGGRFYGHYFTACTASASVALAVSLDALFRERSARVGVVGVLLVPLCVNAALDLASSFVNRKKISPPEEAQVHVARFLRAAAAPSETLFVWEYAPLIYQSSGLQNAFPWTTSINLFDSPARGARLFREILQRWNSAPPSMVVWSAPSADGDSALHRSTSIRDYERQLRAILEARYDRIYSEERYSVHRLRDGPSTATARPRVGVP